MKKKTVPLLLILILFILSSPVASAGKSKRLDGIGNFSASYREALEKLQEKHPNWSFTVLQTGVDWKKLLYMQTEENHARSLISNTMPDAWKCNASRCFDRDTGLYISHEREDRMGASKEAVAYALDPRNYLTEELIFQFENLSFDPKIHTIQGVEQIFNGSDFYDKQVIYTNKAGKQTDMNKKYADIVMEAAKKSKVSPYHLASRIRHETLGNLDYESVCGTVEGFRGFYNFYNIGATAAADPTINGLNYAKKAGWTDPAKSIIKGAQWIGGSYINKGQNTLYLQKFDVDDSDGRLYWHQYMTYIMTPVIEQAKVYNAYKEMGILDMPMNFIIPAYENMPDSPVAIPDGEYLNYRNVDEKTMVYLYANPAFSDIIKKLHPEEETPETRIETQPETSDGTEPSVSLTNPLSPTGPVQPYARYIILAAILLLIFCAAGIVIYRVRVLKK